MAVALLHHGQWHSSVDLLACRSRYLGPFDARTTRPTMPWTIGELTPKTTVLFEIQLKDHPVGRSNPSRNQFFVHCDPQNASSGEMLLDPTIKLPDLANYVQQDPTQEKPGARREVAGLRPADNGSHFVTHDPSDTSVYWTMTHVPMTLDSQITSYDYWLSYSHLLHSSTTIHIASTVSECTSLRYAVITWWALRALKCHSHSASEAGIKNTRLALSDKTGNFSARWPPAM